MLKRASALLVGSLVAPLVAAPVLVLGAAAQAAPAASFPPNPCRTFTPASADKVFGISTHTVLPEKLTKTTQPYVIRTCTVKHSGHRLTVQTQFHQGATGNLNCHRRTALGPRGEICQSPVPSSPFTLSVFKKDGVWVSAGINEQLPHQGARLYRFALAQYAKFMG